jgi:hypothetical protein
MRRCAREGDVWMLSRKEHFFFFLVSNETFSISDFQRHHAGKFTPSSMLLLAAALYIILVSNTVLARK